MQPVADCIADLNTVDANGDFPKFALLRDTEWGKNVRVEWGEKNKKGKHSSGAKHIVYRRMNNGLSLDEAAFVVVCVLKTVQSVQPVEQKNRRIFERFGIRAIVAEDSPNEIPLLSGFIITPKHKKGAGETAAPLAGTQLYALDELARTQEVGAALSSALSRFDAIVKQNSRQSCPTRVRKESQKLSARQAVRDAGLRCSIAKPA